MASRAFALTGAALVALLTVAPLIAIAARGAGATMGAADWSAVRFTLIQSALSALISTLLAVPVARALARRSFPGKGVLITLLGAPFILPVIVAVLGLLTVFGRSGWFSAVVGTPINIYGMTGVLLAHVFFNLPLATRLILQEWVSVPAERFRLAASLGFTPTTYWQVIEWRVLRRALPGAFLLVFLICLSSFTVALTLGGGPKATTVELAIYQAIRFQFDLSKAALLSLVQVGVCLSAALLASWIVTPPTFGQGLGRLPARWDGKAWWQKASDTAWITLAAVFLLVPLTACVVRGAPALTELSASLWPALARSLVVAVASALIALSLALAVCLGRGAALAVALPMAVSPLVLGTGWFLLVGDILPSSWRALPLTAMTNGLMAMPFCLRTLMPTIETITANNSRLTASLGLTGWARFRIVTLPMMRPALGFAGGLAMALSMGDLGVIALFGTGKTETLPLYLYGLMGTYQMDAAAAVGLLLTAVAFGLFWAADTWGRNAKI